jgi:hypothetical protein
VSLTETAVGAGSDQASVALSALPEAPKRRTIRALPSSLGLSVAAMTPAGSTRRRS